MPALHVQHGAPALCAERVIYPGERHGNQRPSCVRDRYQSYVDWYEKYLGSGDRAG